jgi:hypothetical protein
MREINSKIVLEGMTPTRIDFLYKNKIPLRSLLDSFKKFLEA